MPAVAQFGSVTASIHLELKMIAPLSALNHRPGVTVNSIRGQSRDAESKDCYRHTDSCHSRRAGKMSMHTFPPHQIKVLLWYFCVARSREKIYGAGSVGALPFRIVND